MTKEIILKMMRQKRARIDLVRGIKGDLQSWGLQGNIEQMTQIMLRFEQYQMEMGDRPFYFGLDSTDKSP